MQQKNGSVHVVGKPVKPSPDKHLTTATDSFSSFLNPKALLWTSFALRLKPSTRPLVYLPSKYSTISFRQAKIVFRKDFLWEC
ncbi:hypothetical protein SAMN06296036_112145 [Pseudobacteriovorax antillogorgiicola]|uniref:Uncharacterized protein n=1 Tax=Pseudobacteriovorax antillogorgiicola TaxID=1513793 RepID=A0A1Y6C9H7_9BACT|nr:hypothetical protein EDD56_112146 [Pseudobacteriovorax antillogorgiicola]SMF41213.1 hypothetical protein SAMN06296036_112145 [Pseudobacteriovorax antillogorgiicola]